MLTSFVPWLDGFPRVANTSRSNAAPRPDEVEQNRAGWSSMIDGPLAAMNQDPSSLESEGLTPPSNAAVRMAQHFAAAGRDQGWPPPHRVSANGDGGIFFER